jgi:hypothetical protein
MCLIKVAVSMFPVTGQHTVKYSDMIQGLCCLQKLKMRTGGMDPSRGKRKSRTSQRSKPSRPVQKPDDNTLQAAREKAAASYLESKPQGELMHVNQREPLSCLLKP